MSARAPASLSPSLARSRLPYRVVHDSNARSKFPRRRDVAPDPPCRRRTNRRYERQRTRTDAGSHVAAKDEALDSLRTHGRGVVERLRRALANLRAFARTVGQVTGRAGRAVVAHARRLPAHLRPCRCRTRMSRAGQFVARSRDWDSVFVGAGPLLTWPARADAERTILVPAVLGDLRAPARWAAGRRARQSTAFAGSVELPAWSRRGAARCRRGQGELANDRHGSRPTRVAPGQLRGRRHS